MTASEFAFLGLGLILGLAAGAALIEIIRARPPSAREVRLTVAADAVPRRRSATLSNDLGGGAAMSAEAAFGGPADETSDGGDRRTPVLEPRPGTIAEPAFRLAGPDSHHRQPVPVSGGHDPMLTALRSSAAASAVAAMHSPARAAVLAGRDRSAEEPWGDDRGRTAAGTTDRPTGETPKGGRRSGGRSAEGAASARGGSPPRADDASDADPSGPCAEPRRLADERCELADRARERAAAAEEAHRAAQRAYDEHEQTAAAAADQADARAVRRAKDQAQSRFRAGRAAATVTEEVEAAARAWLLEINAINNDAREAAAILARERVAAQTIALDLERAVLDADAARIAAESAEAACLAAREAVADCEERQAGGASPGHFPVMPSQGDDGLDRDDPLAGALRAGDTPRIFRLLHGDREAMQTMVAALGGDDEGERRRWRTSLSDLVDAILADSLAANALQFPHEHPFWGPYDRAQSRDVVGALSSLGYRFDGRGGWIDDRVPSQRDLSLALGYAGIDPMRMRQWPTETEMRELFAEVQVSAAEHLAGAAGDLTLGELVTLLGRRADGLTDVWNAWGRIRPLLLEDT